MKSFHTVGEHNRAIDLDRSTNKLMLNLGSKNNSSRRIVEEIIGVRKGLNPFIDASFHVKKQKDFESA